MPQLRGPAMPGLVRLRGMRSWTAARSILATRNDRKDFWRSAQHAFATMRAWRTRTRDERTGKRFHQGLAGARPAILGCVAAPVAAVGSRRAAAGRQRDA